MKHPQSGIANQGNSPFISPADDGRENQIIGKKAESDTGILNFFRKIVTNQLQGKKKENADNVVAMRPPLIKTRKQILLSAPRPHVKPHEIQMAARLLQARLQTDPASDWALPAGDQVSTPGKIYRYRSKADITYTNLPAIVINQ